MGPVAGEWFAEALAAVADLEEHAVRRSTRQDPSQEVSVGSG